MKPVPLVNTKINRLIEKLLKDEEHQALAKWAADCAERVLVHYENEFPDDPRPRLAIETCRDWVRGKAGAGEAHSAAFEAHDAARATSYAPAAAAHAAGHAADTARDATHAIHAAAYAAKAVALLVPAEAGPNTVKERNWQYQRLLETVSSLHKP